MPDKKLIDSEIIKALECCKSDTALCNECPYDKIGECIEKMCADSIDLINRLQAENERLKEEICIQHKIIDERGAEVLRHDRCIRTLHEKLETAKAEAYKEFAERLDKASFITSYTTVFGGKDVPIKHITMANVHSILKELVGEDNESKN